MRQNDLSRRAFLGCAVVAAAMPARGLQRNLPQGLYYVQLEASGMQPAEATAWRQWLESELALGAADAEVMMGDFASPHGALWSARYGGVQVQMVSSPRSNGTLTLRGTTETTEQAVFGVRPR